jgi:hypothetical protein
MANICVSKIAVIGLKEPPEEFIKKLSKLMFDIDLDDIDTAKWGHPEMDGKTWYRKIAHDKYPPLCILVPGVPFVAAGVAVPRFKVETKWKPPYEQLLKASVALPDLTFSLGFWIDQDGPTGEIIIRAGKEIEHDVTPESWYLFDQIKYPRLSLLLRYIPMTLAQRGQAAIETARDFVEHVHGVLHDRRFIESPYDEYRDRKAVRETTKVIEALLAHCETAAKTLSFKGVFVSDDEVSRSKACEDWPDTEGSEVPADFEKLPTESVQTRIGLVEQHF